MRLIVVRHGESEWNREGRIMGRADIALTDLGRRQAHAVVQALLGERIQAVYCSPLKRAMETGRLISIDQGCSLVPDPDLQELGRGNLEGMARGDAFTIYPDLQTTWPDVPCGRGLHGQESLEELNLRVRRCLDRIKGNHRAETMALVAHYFVNLMILLDALKMEPRYFWSFGQDIAAISILEGEGDRWTICLLNDVCHLRKG
jgi:broad specificity phosphatase PhoE